jgi:hypothetical protein
MALGPIQSPIWDSSPVGEVAVRSVPPSSAEVKNLRIYTSTPPVYFHGVTYNYPNYIFTL